MILKCDKVRRLCNNCKKSYVHNFKDHKDKICERLFEPGTKVKVSKPVKDLGWTLLKCNGAVEKSRKAILNRLQKTKETKSQRAKAGSLLMTELKKVIRKKTKSQKGQLALKRLGRTAMHKWNNVPTNVGLRAMEYLVFGMMAHHSSSFNKVRLMQGVLNMSEAIGQIKDQF